MKNTAINMKNERFDEAAWNAPKILVVEAMASHRPYRPALGIEVALDEIEQNAVILYDPEVVDACLRLFREKNFTFCD